jgi:hypothetical protein
MRRRNASSGTSRLSSPPDHPRAIPGGRIGGWRQQGVRRFAPRHRAARRGAVRAAVRTVPCPRAGRAADIDLDTESGRREEVIQFVYDHYGRDRAAQVANVISYRSRSAVRDIAKAFEYAQGQQDAWSKQLDQWGSTVGADHDIPAEAVAMAETLLTFPRHLGIHSGGMVLCDRPAIEVCPVESGRMPGRTVLHWDKDDSSLGMSRTAQRSWLCNTAGRHRGLLSETSARSGPCLRHPFRYPAWHGGRCSAQSDIR